ncbi:MAG: DUF4111 domain-containing protein [Chloroflexota bacterium]|nr:DUF4111 domain-containing protein [Chloroflexota bacterium]MDE2908395.1 DUF4111 domain-containing protein [Chloroflexota bacterium]
MTRHLHFTLDDTVRPILPRLLGGLQSILQDNLVGVYLYGSLITGDFDPGISDIDLVVVLNQALDEAEFESLHKLHQGIIERQPEWQDRLELAYISAVGLRTFRSRSSAIGIISPGEPFHILEAGSDWLISWHALREDGVALTGPPINTLIDDIPTTEYLQAVAEHIRHYRDSVKKPHNKQALSYIVLTVARGIYTLAHCRPASKAKAAAWAKARYPQWAELIERAWSWRANPQSDLLTAEQIRPQVADYVNNMLSRLSNLDDCVE